MRRFLVLFFVSILCLAFQFSDTAYSDDGDAELVSDSKSNVKKDSKWSVGPKLSTHFFHDNYFGTAIAGSLRLSEIWSLGAFAGAQSSNFHSWEPFFGGEIEFEILNRYRNSVSGSFRLKGSLLVGLYQVETIAFGFATQHRQVFATTPGLVVSQDLWSILRISLGYHAGPAWRLGGYDEETRVPPLAQMIHLQAAITL